jgi:ABC-type branched-subunit amino acid transport system substrate-binding protein
MLSGAAAVAPVAPGTVGSAVARSVFGFGGPIKIGIIVPRGTSSTDSLLSGIGLHLHEINNAIGGSKIELIVEDSTGTSSLLKKTQKLVEKDKVDLVIAHANSRAATIVHDYVAEHSVVFIEMNAGEVMPRNEAVPSTYFRSTLNLWQAQAAMGAWAANTIGKTAAIQTSFSNSGFDFHSAFAFGFEANGGTIVSRIVTGSPADAEHPISALSAAKKLQPAVIYASYSGQVSEVFAQAYRSSGITAPVLGTIGASEDSHLASSWVPTIASKENESFIEAYTSFNGKQPDAFAVLGYDTIRFALEGARSGAHGSSLASALLGTRMTSPRGECSCDSMTHSLTTPLYLSGPSAEVISLGGQHSDLAMANAGEQRGGWLNNFIAA